MRLFNFLRRAQPASEPAPVVLTGSDSAGADMFSLEDTTRLHQLFEAPSEQRDERWKSDFFGACWNASVFLSDPAYFNGPDGLPYFRMNLPQPGMSFEAQCLAGLARTCLDGNAGVAFFRHADDPIGSSQWVISMGEIDSLLRFGHANGDPADVEETAPLVRVLHPEPSASPARAATTSEPHSVLVGSPSRTFLPDYTARALYRLMNSWGEADPRVGLIVDTQLRPSRNLVICRKRSQFANEEEASFELSRAAWMLPPARGVMLMPEDWSSREMTRLGDLF